MSDTDMLTIDTVITLEKEIINPGITVLIRYKTLRKVSLDLSRPRLQECWKVARSSWKSVANAILIFKYVTMVYGPRALKAAQRAQV